MHNILSVTNKNGSKCEEFCDIKDKQENDILYLMVKFIYEQAWLGNSEE